MKEALVEYRPASAAECEVVKVLLQKSHLPTEGVGEMGPNLIAAVEGGSVIGASGLEIYGTDGLLRSVVVADEWRGHGLGRQLVRRTLDLAVQRGLKNVYLLTEGAAEYFAALGFRRINREDVKGKVIDSAEFSHLCPSTAVAMVLHLDRNVKEEGEEGDGKGSQR
ncbi:MAG: GNAT family N-acetyltransferase [Acidimicrobiia bacterium]|nr:GNAT family N-acetyltransferase [Acidimicrobiia bacterium]